MLIFGLVAAALMGYLGGFFGFGTAPAAVSLLAILVISWPALLEFWRALGWGRGLMLFVVLSIMTIGVEFVGVVTGFPYGSFQYIGNIGYRVFGVVPWTVPFAWLPLLFAAISLADVDQASIVRGSAKAAGLLILMDIVLDPGAVAVGLWKYAYPGLYYEVPWTNFAGWMLVGFCASIFLVHVLRVDFSRRAFLISAAWMLSFWSGVAVARSLWIPVFLGSILILSIVYRYVSRSETLTHH